MLKLDMLSVIETLTAPVDGMLVIATVLVALVCQFESTPYETYVM